jgi:hypothetical protein
MNGPDDFSYITLNSEYKPTSVWSPIANVNLLWTHTTKTSKPDGTWTPNHFVPVFRPQEPLNSSFLPANHSSPIQPKGKENAPDESEIVTHDLATAETEMETDNTRHTYVQQFPDQTLPDESNFVPECHSSVNT